MYFPLLYLVCLSFVLDSLYFFLSGKTIKGFSVVLPRYCCFFINRLLTNYNSIITQIDMISHSA